jgi:hypothetical protein
MTNDREMPDLQWIKERTHEGQRLTRKQQDAITSLFEYLCTPESAIRCEKDVYDSPLGRFYVKHTYHQAVHGRKGTRGRRSSSRNLNLGRGK